MGKQLMDGWTHSWSSQCPEDSLTTVSPAEATGWTVSAKWGDHDTSLGKGERGLKTDLQYRKDEAIGCCKMVRKHFKELFYRRKEDDVLSFEQIRFEKIVAHPGDGFRGAGLEYRSGLYTQV